MSYIISFVIAYLLGSINTSILVSKISLGTDIRNHGSGNAGATNALRTLGKKAAIIVVIGDLLKGIIAVLIARYISSDTGSLIGGLGAILGHNFPIYFQFKGGKGIITSIAVLFMINWKMALVILIISIVIIALTRYVSLGSIIGSCLYPISVYLFDKRGIEYIIFAVIIALLAVIRHKDNIKRLVKGNESKLGSKAK